MDPTCLGFMYYRYRESSYEVSIIVQYIEYKTLTHDTLTPNSTYRDSVSELLCVRIQQFEYFAISARRYPWHVARTIPYHGEGLARAGLSVRENADVVAVHRRLDQHLHVAKHALLGAPGVGREHLHD